MNREEFRQWATLHLTLEVFELLQARRKELMECVVTSEVSNAELFRIRGIVHCMDALMSGDIIDEDDEEED